jgi:FMN phosphatase YigB (HAD superfamily)
MTTTKQGKTTLITDLDNTLFDWVDVWVKSFTRMLDKVVEISQIPREILIPEIANIHQQHGTSEYAFLLEELPSLRSFCGGSNVLETFTPAIDAFRVARRANLKLFPGVIETLAHVRAQGTLVIGYTESMSFYSNYRIKKLGLDGVLDYLFSPEDHPIPTHISREDYRKYPASYYELTSTAQRFTPKGSKKPDTAVLNKILNEVAMDRKDCAYIGDSLMKDIAMANDCGVTSVWARYGQAHTREEYNLLRQVTHWTAEEVEREKRLNAREHVVPDFTASTEFAELLGFFDFRPHRKHP